MTFTVSNPNASKLAALKAARQAAQVKPDALVKWISPAEARNRDRIIFDDSGSMSSEIENAKTGTIEYLRNCPPNQSAVAVHFLNTQDEELASLNSDLMQVAERLKAKHLKTGGTPLFTTITKAMDLTPFLTRMIVFTDGEPTDKLAEYDRNAASDDPTLFHMLRSADIVIAKAKDRKAPIDTVYFGPDVEYTQRAIKFLKYLAEKTGGYFLHFDPAKVSFAKAFKYLAPANRLMLASESVRKEIEDGKRA
jgi:Mg-chelatase subunit ChlD